MKRDVIVGKLIVEGLSEKTLVRLNDNQLLSLAERMLSEQMKKGSVVMSKTTSNPNDVKKLTDQGLNVELREKENKHSKKCDNCGKSVKDCNCNQSHLEESPDFGKKVTKGHNNIPEFMDSKKLKESEVKKWVKGLVENEKFHSFTSKNEIMELIQVKLNENKPSPSKPDTDTPVREKPTTKPGKPKRENPFEPKHTPKPKALGEDNDGTKTAPAKPKVEPSKKPKKENPFEPKHAPKPKALGEQGEKNKMPEFMKFKNLGFKFKDQN